MTPEEFIAKWRGSELSERAAAQSHFIDLCSVLGVLAPTPASAADYAFEKATRKIGERQGYADVWKRGCFAWEYKGNRRNLVEAYAQLKQYADALENPPLLIVSDMQEIRVRTNFTNTIAQEHVIKLPDLISPQIRNDLLRNCFSVTGVERLRPNATRESVTAEAATRFASIAVALRQRYDEREVAHFINKLVFCLFAEDIDLLPDRVFAVVVDESIKRPDDFEPMLRDLFGAMAHGRRYGPSSIQWFNGGLFDDDHVLPLGLNQLNDLRAAAGLDWKAIDPAIFGTLFESGLDDKRRAEMASLFDAPEPEHAVLLLHAPAANRGVGIHYTDEATIMKIIEPVVVAPLRREWEGAKEHIRELDERRVRAQAPAQREQLLADARGRYADFRARLGRYRVLDPACGSGNFLALSLRALKDLDLAVLDEATAMGLPLDNFRIGPEAVLGIEINAYAAELARLTVWITELQWQVRKGLALTRRPILDKLDGIVRADALLTPSGNEREWPAADVIVGNPPFLGGKRLRSGLGDAYVDRLFATFAGRVPREADLVAYWFAKAHEQLRDGKLRRAGLVATNSMRGGANRRVLDRVVQDEVIFDAWDDEPWVIQGAAVRVSLICFAEDDGQRPMLDGRPADRIGSDLTASKSDLTKARPLTENKGVAFMGDTKGGGFDIPGDLARQWLQLPLNPNGRPNSDVLRPWVNGMDLTRSPSGRWIIDFGWEMDERKAALYEVPFAYCLTYVKPERDKNRRDTYRRFWWRHVEPRPGMYKAIGDQARYIATPTVAKHRLFCWRDSTVCPDHQLIVTARDDDTTFGILQSRFHEAWAIALCTWLGVGNDPRYTPSTTFETFPFPEGLTPNILAVDYADDSCAVAIAKAARRLNEFREAWLDPPDLVERVPEVVPGYPARLLPKNPEAAAILKKRTLTNLYNQRPAWLDHSHQELDAAVAAAYGWPANISEEDALARLLALNLERAAAGR